MEGIAGAARAAHEGAFARNPLKAMAKEALFAGLLREFVLDYDQIVTPHFTTSVAAFAAPAFAPEYGFAVPDAPPRAYLIIEHGGTSLADLPDELKRNVEFRAAVFMQVATALDAARDHFGFIHNDLHWYNLFVRSVGEDPRYANRPWVYLRPDGTSWVLTPAQHRNLMVKIIDYDLAMLRRRPWTRDNWHDFYQTLSRAVADRSNTAHGDLSATDKLLLDYTGWGVTLSDQELLAEELMTRLPLLANHIQRVDTREPPANYVVVGNHAAAPRTSSRSFSSPLTDA
jgi:hypothetical protein